MKKHFGYIGQAGTGKTSTLIKDLEEYLNKVEWKETDTLLALTFMHGSRKRLSQKLQHFSKKYHLECLTIDSFAVAIVQRYRRYLGINCLIVISSDNDSSPTIHLRDQDVLVNLSYVRTKAIELMKMKSVQACISNTYPYIVVDEFQDCESELFELVKVLSETTVLLLAADDFQNLNSVDIECEATKWLKLNTNVTQLTRVYRTTNTRILESANALRSNIKTTGGISVELTTNHHLAAYKILSLINWKFWGKKGSNIAVLSPVGPTSSDFIAKILERIKAPFEKHPSLFPIHFREENKTEEALDILLALMPNYDLATSISMSDLDLWSSINHPIVKATIKSAKRLFQIKGLLFMEKNQFQEIIQRQSHLFRTYVQGSRNENFIFTTIHGAKNREFDYIIIVWPYQGKGTPIPKRKLLYNAITRAKKDAILLIQSKDAAGTVPKKDAVFSLLF